MKQRLPNAKAVFDQALEIEATAERNAFLDTACAGAPELRQQVQALLQSYAEAGNFLEQPVVDLAATTDAPPSQAVAKARGAGASPAAWMARLTESPGSWIGPYKLRKKIGEGGMGAVFLAEQTQPVQRQVALKVIRPGMDSQQVIARFEAERQALALMDHPHIAKVFDAGTTESGRPYFVMELVKGVPITQYCDLHRLTLRERLELLVPVCQAVQHAHQKGIIHRDLKPSNVLVAQNGGRPVPTIIDFGVAKATGPKLTEQTLYTEFGSVVGTLEYMSPEQADFKQFDIDTRSDIYALGVLLYELLTGSTPLERQRLKEASLIEILRIIREEEPPRPSMRLSGTRITTTSPHSALRAPRWYELDWIVMKCLEKDRNRRYESSNSLAQDIERYLRDEPVQACPPSAWYQFGKFARRNKGALTVATSVTLAVLLAVIGLVISNVLISRERNEKGLALGEKEIALGKAQVSEIEAKAQEVIAKQKANEAEQERQTAKGESKRAREQEQSANRYLYSARLNLVQQAIEVGRWGRALALLEEQRPGPNQEDLRGFEWYYLWQVCHEDHLRTLRGHGDQVSSVAYSADGTLLASGSRDGTVRLWDPSTGQLRWILSGHGGLVSSVAFSPDSKVLASGSSDRTVKLWDVATGEERATLSGHQKAVTRLAFAPDGSLLVSGGWDNHLTLWDVPTGEVRATLKGNINRIEDVAFSPDSKTVAAIEYSHIRLWDVATGEQRLHYWPHRFYGTCVAFSPDGKTLASAGRDRIVKLCDPATGKELASFSDHSSYVLKLAFSPDGQNLAVGTAEGTVKVWDLSSREARAYGHSAPVNALAFAPDGKTLATASDDRTVRLWNVARTLVPTPAAPEQQMVWSVAFSPDGKTLASGGDKQPIRLWDVATRQVRHSLNAHTAPVITVTFSPDGKTLASCGDDATVRLWDVAGGKELAVLKDHKDSVFGVAFSPDGRTLATSGKDQTVRLWDLATSQVRTRLEGHPDWVWSVAFSRDGRTLASAGAAPGIRLWDVAEGRQRLLLKAGRLAAQFSPDGKTLATPGAGDRTVNLWDSETGQERVSLKGTASTGYNGLAFLRDGKILARVNDEGSLTLWDVTTAMERVTLRERHHWIYSVAFSPDGRTLATGGWDGTVRFRQTATEQEVLAQSHVADYREELARSHVSEGDTLQRSGQPKEAEKAYRQAVALLVQLADDSPRVLTYRLELVALYKRLKENHKVAAELTKTIDTGPGDWRFWLDRGCAYRDLREWDKAIADFSKAIELKPDVASNWNSRGIAYYRMGEPRKAIADYSKAIELDPHLSVFWSNRARSHEVLRQWDKAQDDFARAIELNPKDPGVWNSYGLVHKQLNQLPEAISALSKLIELRPGDAEAWFNRARLHERLRHWDKALADYSKVIELKPDYQAAYHWRGHVHEKLDKLNEALRDFSIAIQGDPKVAHLRGDRGRVHMRLRNFDQAVADFSRAIELKPEDARNWNGRGWARLGLRQWDEAIKDSSKAIGLQPDLFAAWTNLGDAYAAQGNWEKASFNFEKAIALGARDSEFGYKHALLQLHLGDREGSRKSCADLLERFGETPNAQQTEWAARAYCLSPGAGADPEPVARLIQKAALYFPKSDVIARTHGVALLRAGRLEAAVNELRRAMSLRQRELPEAWLHLALAHHQLGRATEARKWLERAARWIEQDSRAKLKEGLSAWDALPWHERLYLEMLRREAETLIRAGTGAKNSNEK